MLGRLRTISKTTDPHISHLLEAIKKEEELDEAHETILEQLTRDSKIPFRKLPLFQRKTEVSGASVLYEHFDFSVFRRSLDFRESITGHNYKMASKYGLIFDDKSMAAINRIVHIGMSGDYPLADCPHRITVNYGDAEGGIINRFGFSDTSEWDPRVDLGSDSMEPVADFLQVNVVSKPLRVSMRHPSRDRHGIRKRLKEFESSDNSISGPKLLRLFDIMAQHVRLVSEE